MCDGLFGPCHSATLGTTYDPKPMNKHAIFAWPGSGTRLANSSMKRSGQTGGCANTRWSAPSVPGPDVIAAVSETLQGVLSNAVSTLDNPPPTAELSNLQGNISTNPARLTIFLFEV